MVELEAKKNELDSCIRRNDRRTQEHDRRTSNAVGYKKSEDDQVLKEVERVLKAKKSDKRVTALVNRMRVAKGLLK